jgi:hypothetical protein
MTVIQLKNSNTANKRPNPTSLVDGELAINTNAAEPGVYFKNTAGGLVKAGPVFVGGSAPNSNPAGFAGNSIGELWADSTNINGGFVPLKVYTSQGWKPAYTTNNLDGVTNSTITSLGVGSNRVSPGVFVGVNAGAGLTSGSFPNVCIGDNAKCGGGGNNENVSIGYRAGANKTQANNQGNVYIGAYSGENSTVNSYNVGIGYQTLRATTGSGRTAVGYQALAKATEGGGTAVGYASLTNLTTGYFNTAVGSESLANIVSGSSNIGLGAQAGYDYTGNASGNISLGNNSGCRDGASNNITIGHQAGKGHYGSNNIFLGHGAGSGGGNGNYNVVIGPYTANLGTTSKRVILCNGLGDVYLYFNENGAMGVKNGLGTAGAPLISGGTTTSPSWGAPGVTGTFVASGSLVRVENGVVVSVS